MSVLGVGPSTVRRSGSNNPVVTPPETSAPKQAPVSVPVTESPRPTTVSAESKEYARERMTAGGNQAKDRLDRQMTDPQVSLDLVNNVLAELDGSDVPADEPDTTTTETTSAAPTTTAKEVKGLDPHHRLDKVHPEVAERIRKTALELEKQGIKVTVVSGRRTFEEQNKLYAQGRTKPGDVVTNARGGYSNHNYGLAVDLAPLDKKGNIDWDAPKKTWDALGAAGKKQGLEWGGDWQNLTDQPHFQLPVGMDVRECLKLYKQGGLKKVWEEANIQLQK